jgi:FkbM family methyltransferase
MKKLFKRFINRGWGGNLFIKNIFSKIIVFILNPITIYGNKIFLDYSDGIDHIVKDYKKYPMKVCFDNIKKGDVVLDIGGNIGIFAVAFSKVVENGKIFCFEASPKNCKLIKKNIISNKCKNIILENKAVLNENKKVKIYLSRETKYNKLFKDSGSKKCIEVEGIKLDDYFNYKERIDFIKVDIVGSEYLAIKGMLNIITNNPQVKIAMEFSPNRIEKTNSSPIELLLILKKLGFNIFSHNDKEEKLELIEDYRELVKDKETKYLFFERRV